MVYRSPHDEDEGDLITGTRVCRSCKARKPMTNFFWANGRKYRVRICSDCKIVQAREKREQNRDQSARRSFLTNLRISYGMTEEDYWTLMEAQSRRCAICRGDFGDRAPHVDHDHKTAVVRGILCFTCNTAIGKMRDDPSLLRAAASYLEREPPRIGGRPRRLSREEVSAARSAARRGKVRRHSRPRGESASAARLSDADASAIAARYRAGGISQQDLAEEFGCSQSLVSLIIRGKVRIEATGTAVQENGSST